MSLTKKDCLAALKQFTARWDKQDEIYSDKSTAFHESNGGIEFKEALATNEN